MNKFYEFLKQISDKLVYYFLIVKEELSLLFFSFFHGFFFPYLTEAACHNLSDGLALALTAAIFAKLIIIIFNKGSASADHLLKTFIHRIFSSVAWIFTSIADSVKRILFGK